MAALRRCRGPCHLFGKFHRPKWSTMTRTCSMMQNLQPPNEKTQEIDDDDAHYPPVKPKLPPGSWGQMDRRFAWEWHEDTQEISRFKTVQDKLYYLTHKKYRTWKYEPIARVPRLFDYQCDKTKTYTVTEPRTATDIKHSRLPDVYKGIKLDNQLINNCEKLLQNHIRTFSYINNAKMNKRVTSLKPVLTSKHVPEVDEASAHLRSKELLMALISYLSGEYDHIRRCTVDENVRVAATWYRHGVTRFQNSLLPDKSGLIFRKRPKDYKPRENSAFFAEHTVNLQIRKEKPLQQFIPLSDPLTDGIAYPLSPYRPSVLGQFHEVLRRGIDPGFNDGDPNSFTHVNVVLLTNRYLMRMLREYGEETYEGCLMGYALSTGFLSAVAQAHYQGFNMYEELTYPITTQTILTDGHDFMFSAYQLNTLQLWKDDIAVPYHNVCWVSRPQPLWTQKEEKDDSQNVVKVENLIDRKTLETLLKFLLMPSAEIENTRPNLSAAPAKIDEIHIPSQGQKPVAFATEFQKLGSLENKFKILRPHEYENLLNLKRK